MFIGILCVCVSRLSGACLCYKPVHLFGQKNCHADCVFKWQIYMRTEWNSVNRPVYVPGRRGGGYASFFSLNTKSTVLLMLLCFSFFWSWFCVVCTCARRAHKCQSSLIRFTQSKTCVPANAQSPSIYTQILDFCRANAKHQHTNRIKNDDNWLSLQAYAALYGLLFVTFRVGSIESRECRKFHLFSGNSHANGAKCFGFQFFFRRVQSRTRIFA